MERISPATESNLSYREGTGVYLSLIHISGDERIPEVVKDMESELGAGNKKPEILSLIHI